MDCVSFGKVGSGIQRSSLRGRRNAGLWYRHRTQFVEKRTFWRLCPFLLLFGQWLLAAEKLKHVNVLSFVEHKKERFTDSCLFECGTCPGMFLSVTSQNNRCLLPTHIFGPQTSGETKKLHNPEWTVFHLNRSVRRWAFGGLWLVFWNLLLINILFSCVHTITNTVVWKMYTLTKAKKKIKIKKPF